MQLWVSLPSIYCMIPLKPPALSLHFVSSPLVYNQAKEYAKGEGEFVVTRAV